MLAECYWRLFGTVGNGSLPNEGGARRYFNAPNEQSGVCCWSGCSNDGGSWQADGYCDECRPEEGRQEPPCARTLHHRLSPTGDIEFARRDAEAHVTFRPGIDQTLDGSARKTGLIPRDGSAWRLEDDSGAELDGEVLALHFCTRRILIVPIQGDE